MRPWLLAITLAVAQIAYWPGSAFARHETPGVGQVLVVLTVTAIVTVALGLRARVPVVAALVVPAALTLGSLLVPFQVWGIDGDALTVCWAGEFVVVFNAAARSSLRTTLLVVAAVTAMEAASSALDTSSAADIAFGLAGGLTMYGLVAVAGRLRRRWLAARSEAARHLELARQAVREAEAAERRRLARELHDVTAHHLTSIVVNANAAQLIGATRPELAAEALANAARIGRETLVALRRLVAVLPSEGDGTPGAPPPLGDLVDDFRQLGQPVELDAGEVAPEAAETVHAVVREALTNALRYAPGAAVRVRVSSASSRTEVVVENEAVAVVSDPGLGSGRGVAGLRERLAAFGGSVEAGPLPGGGWRVHASIPAAPKPPRLRRWLSSQAALDAGLVGLSLIFPLATIGEEGFDGVLVGLAAALAHSLPLLWRRERPWTVFALVAATVWLGPLIMVIGLGSENVALYLAFAAIADLAAVYAAVAYGARPQLAVLAPLGSALNGGLAIAVILLLASTDMAPGTLFGLVLLTGFMTVMFLIPAFGVWLPAFLARRRRERRIYREWSAVAGATAQASLMAMHERARIATGLRQAVLHHAARVPDAADAGDLDGVVTSARAALAAMRALLDSLSGKARRDEEVTSSASA
jgi:signal transduction histidine kinase